MDIIVRGSVSPTTGGNAPQPAGELSFDTLHASVINSPSLNPSIQRVMLLMLDSANGDLAKAQANIEAWFNGGMERVAGWYKRKTQWVLLVIGLFIAVSMNVDTLKIANELYRHESLRAGVVAQASSVTKGGSINPELSEKALDTLEGLSLPIGWYLQNTTTDPPAVFCTFNEIVGHFPGWLLTALAISLGAPFWFDLLNKLITIRSTVKPREKSQETPSKDQLLSPSQATGGVITREEEPDDEDDVDGCDVSVKDSTPDEELPVSEGGVARYA
jgi:hypothetical protein